MKKTNLKRIQEKRKPIQRIIDDGIILGYRVDFIPMIPEADHPKVTFEISFFPDTKEYDAFLEAFNMSQRVSLIRFEEKK